MTELTPSMPDVAEELMQEFESLIAVSTVTEVVLRLSRKGQATLTAVSDMAREELRALATGPASSVPNLGDAVPALESQPEGA